MLGLTHPVFPDMVIEYMQISCVWARSCKPIAPGMPWMCCVFPGKWGGNAACLGPDRAAFPSGKSWMDKEWIPPGGCHSQALVKGGEKWLCCQGLSWSKASCQHCPLHSLPWYQLQQLQGSQHTAGGRFYSERQGSFKGMRRRP